MSPKATKNTSLVLVAIATLLIILRTLNLKAVGSTEAGLWYPAPILLRKVMLVIYPVLLLLSFILFRISKKEKTRFDFMIPALFLLNGMLLLFVLVVFLITHIKSL